MLPAGLEVDEELTKFAATIPEFPDQPDKEGFLPVSCACPILAGETGHVCA